MGKLIIKRNKNKLVNKLIFDIIHLEIIKKRYFRINFKKAQEYFIL
jgi:hypothetical protein